MFLLSQIVQQTVQLEVPHTHAHRRTAIQVPVLQDVHGATGRAETSHSHPPPFGTVGGDAAAPASDGDVENG